MYGILFFKIWGISHTFLTNNPKQKSTGYSNHPIFLLEFLALFGILLKNAGNYILRDKQNKVKNVREILITQILLLKTTIS